MEVPVDVCGIKQFLQDFSPERGSPNNEENVQLRAGIVGNYYLALDDVEPEVLDWTLHYLEQRKCPPILAVTIARIVAQNIAEGASQVINHQAVNMNGGSAEQRPLLESTQLHSQSIGHLHELCNHWREHPEEAIDEVRYAGTIRYEVSVCAIKNGRRKMEDRHVIIHDLNALLGLEDFPFHSYYAVFDGHAGIDAATFAAAHLHVNLIHHPYFLKNTEQAVKDAFNLTDQEILERSARENVKSGCTAVCCLIREKTLYVAWVGDSQVILVRKGVPICLMSPHKPERIDEKKRIEDLGGSVTFTDTWRVNGTLAVSRALGDPEHKPFVSSEPDIVSTEFDGTEDFLVLACDGLWDRLTPENASALVYQYLKDKPDPESVAQYLVTQAKEQGSSDNITAIVVFLRDVESIVASAVDLPSFFPRMQSGIPGDDVNGANHFDAFGGMQRDDLLDKNDPFGLAVKDQRAYYPDANTYNFYPEGYSFSDNSAQANGYGVPHGKLMPEPTTFSELPTPPIDEMVASRQMGDSRFDDYAADYGGEEDRMRPDSMAADKETVKEVASEVVSTAIESAVKVVRSKTPDADEDVSQAEAEAKYAEGADSGRESEEGNVPSVGEDSVSDYFSSSPNPEYLRDYVPTGSEGDQHVARSPQPSPIPEREEQQESEFADLHQQSDKDSYDSEISAAMRDSDECKQFDLEPDHAALNFGDDVETQMSLISNLEEVPLNDRPDRLTADAFEGYPSTDVLDFSLSQTYDRPVMDKERMHELGKNYGEENVECSTQNDERESDRRFDSDNAADPADILVTDPLGEYVRDDTFTKDAPADTYTDITGSDVITPQSTGTDFTTVSTDILDTQSLSSPTMKADDITSTSPEFCGISGGEMPDSSELIGEPTTCAEITKPSASPLRIPSESPLLVEEALEQQLQSPISLVQPMVEDILIPESKSSDLLSPRLPDGDQLDLPPAPGSADAVSPNLLSPSHSPAFGGQKFENEAPSFDRPAYEEETDRPPSSQDISPQILSPDIPDVMPTRTSSGICELERPSSISPAPLSPQNPMQLELSPCENAYPETSDMLGLSSQTVQDAFDDRLLTENLSTQEVQLESEILNSPEAEISQVVDSSEKLNEISSINLMQSHFDTFKQESLIQEKNIVEFVPQLDVAAMSPDVRSHLSEKHFSEEPNLLGESLTCEKSPVEFTQANLVAPVDLGFQDISRVEECDQFLPQENAINQKEELAMNLSNIPQELMPNVTEPVNFPEPVKEPELVTEPIKEPELTTEPAKEPELLTEPIKEPEPVMEAFKEAKPELAVEADSKTVKETEAAPTSEAVAAEVQIEAIPEGVPEAEGVTEDVDSDSEKDGGWSYIKVQEQDKKKAEETNKAVKAEKDVRAAAEKKSSKPAKTSPAAKAPSKPATGDAKRLKPSGTTSKPDVKSTDKPKAPLSKTSQTTMTKKTESVVKKSTTAAKVSGTKSAATATDASAKATTASKPVSNKPATSMASSRLSSQTKTGLSSKSPSSKPAEAKPSPKPQTSTRLASKATSSPSAATASKTVASPRQPASSTAPKTSARPPATATARPRTTAPAAKSSSAAANGTAKPKPAATSKTPPAPKPDVKQTKETVNKQISSGVRKSPAATATKDNGAPKKAPAPASRPSAQSRPTSLASKTETTAASRQRPSSTSLAKKPGRPTKTSKTGKEAPKAGQLTKTAVKTNRKPADQTSATKDKTEPAKTEKTPTPDQEKGAIEVHTKEAPPEASATPTPDQSQSSPVLANGDVHDKQQIDAAIEAVEEIH